MSKEKSYSEKLNFYYDRKRVGDTRKIANQLGYSESHVINVREGRRYNKLIADHLYKLSARRKPNMALSANSDVWKNNSNF